MTLTKNEVEIQKLFNTYAKENYFNISDTGLITEDLDLDYQDLANLQEQINNFKEQNPEYIEDKIIDLLYPSEISRQEYTMEDFYNQYASKLNDLGVHDVTELYDYVGESVINYGVNLQLDRLKERIKINTVIILETEESANREYTNNNFFNLLESTQFDDVEEIYDLQEALNESSLKTLLEKQNYSIDQYVMFLLSDQIDREHPLDDDQHFRSIYNEIFNAYNTNMLLVKRQCTLNEYTKLLKDDQITINKNDEIGYFDPISGSGSLFEINLKQDMTYNKDEYMIRTENTMPGYTISDVYGSFN